MGWTMATSLVRWYKRAKEKDTECYLVCIDTSSFQVVDKPGDDGHGYGSLPVPETHGHDSQPGLLDMSTPVAQKTLQHLNSHIQE
jgi:hypothetical protein